MAKLKIYQERHIDRFLSLRPGETKLGEKVKFISGIEQLRESPAQFVLFGIPEDIGVLANYGQAGTSGAWNACLSSLLNVQDNDFIPSEKIMLLGEVDPSVEMEKASNLESSDPNYFVKLGELVEQIDEVVSATVRLIIEAGKIPIIIGGGHNNAYGNLQGSSRALNSSVNVLNIDAHTDLRRLEHRHSGNGFSYARRDKHLKKYTVFGLHPNYTPQYIFEEMDGTADMEYFLFDEIETEEEILENFRRCIRFINTGKFGLEVDCDAIANFPSSATSPTGFSLNRVRQLVQRAAKEKNCCYLHLCEAIDEESFPTGKALSYLITDYVKSKAND